MLIQPRVLSALGTVLLVIAASPNPFGSSFAASGDVSATTLVERRAIHIRNSDLIALSPDGGWIAVSRPMRPSSSDRSRPNKLCIHEVATLAERTCADVSDLGAGLWVDSVVWSPDSKWLAFAERWGQFLFDGDLWLMDAATGALTNLLDDGYVGALGTTPGEGFASERMITLPSYPAFTSDSAAVTFSRTVIEGGQHRYSDVATVPIRGGEAERLGDATLRPASEYLQKRWSADGSRLFASLVEHQGSGPPGGGIWVLEVQGQRQLLRLDDWPQRILAVSPQGEHLLVEDPRTQGLVARSFAMVDGDFGGMQPIVSVRPDVRNAAPITGVMLSPDGSRLLIVSGLGGKQVAVRDIASASETVLMSEPPGATRSDLAGDVLSWAENDTVLVQGGKPSRGTLLVLDAGDG